MRGRLPIGFDGQLYLKLNPDVAAAGVDPGRHYLEFGQHEGRRFAESVFRESGDLYTRDVPTDQGVIDLFRGDWSSEMPLSSGLISEPGTAKLFEDGRILWMADLLGPITNSTILEIGPLEGGHTYMLHNLGTKSIVAVEVNARAYLRCLCIKEIFELSRARFLLGSGVEFIKNTTEMFDIILASGVLYHLTDPIEFLEKICDRTRKIFIWTHYYDETIIESHPDRGLFDKPLRLSPDLPWIGSRRVYPDTALTWPGFSGGTASSAVWLTRDTILKFLETKGFNEISISFDEKEHQNGPAFAIAAKKAPKVSSS